MALILASNQSPDRTGSYAAGCSAEQHVGRHSTTVSVFGVWKNAMLSRRGHGGPPGGSTTRCHVDRQQSSRQWLALRPDAAPRIQSWDLVGDSTLKTPKGVTHVVLDTPAGGACCAPRAHEPQA